MIIMRNYKRQLPEVSSGEPFSFSPSTFFLLPAGLLHRSHSPRQFARLSESEQGGLSALTPHPGCASYPNRPLLAFRWRARTFLLCSTYTVAVQLSPPPLYTCQQQLCPGGQKVEESDIEREPGLLFNEILKCEGAVCCHKANSGTSAGEANQRPAPSHPPLLLPGNQF